MTSQTSQVSQPSQTSQTAQTSQICQPVILGWLHRNLDVFTDELVEKIVQSDLVQLMVDNRVKRIVEQRAEWLKQEALQQLADAEAKRREENERLANRMSKRFTCHANMFIRQMEKHNAGRAALPHKVIFKSFYESLERFVESMNTLEYRSINAI
jgi:Holliday junction resolvasome RuvABC ATP-dependent DNA helicase subunit